MRRVLFALCVLCCTASAAQKVVKAKTDRVTVYFDGAVVEKLARVDLQKGENTIIFSSNSPTIEPYGIQFDADEGFMVVGFDAETGLPQEFVSYEQSLTADKRKHYKSLCDTIAKLKDALQFEQSRKASLEKQFAALSSIKLMSNPQSQDSLQRIKTTLEYYDQKSAELTKSKMATEAKIKQYNELLKKQQYLYAVFMEENPDNTSSEGQNSREYKIKADIYADKDISGATIRYSYLCTAAGWQGTGRLCGLLPPFHRKRPGESPVLHPAKGFRFAQNRGLSGHLPSANTPEKSQNLLCAPPLSAMHGYNRRT